MVKTILTLSPFPGAPLRVPRLNRADGGPGRPAQPAPDGTKGPTTGV